MLLNALKGVGRAVLAVFAVIAVAVLLVVAYPFRQVAAVLDATASKLAGKF